MRSTEAVTGHLLGASGAVEAAISAMSVGSGILPSARNLDESHPHRQLDHIWGGPRRTRVEAALSNWFGFDGDNASLVLVQPSIQRVQCVDAARCPERSA